MDKSGIDTVNSAFFTSSAYFACSKNVELAKQAPTLLVGDAKYEQ